jgi:hypothetical protein
MRDSLWKIPWSDKSRDLPMITVLILLLNFVSDIAQTSGWMEPDHESPTIHLMFGEPDTRERHGAEGSPFQMPARLAVGLGLESGLGSGYPEPFAPSTAECLWSLGPPHPASGRKPDLGCTAE